MRAVGLLVAVAAVAVAAMVTAVAAAGPTCMAHKKHGKSNSGGAVDVFWVHHIGKGDYYYWDSEFGSALPKYYHVDPTTDADHPLTLTMAGRPRKSDDGSGEDIVMYGNGDGSESGVLSYGTSANDDGFYLMHSIAGFPVDDANAMKSLGDATGAALCITISTAASTGSVVTVAPPEFARTDGVSISALPDLSWAPPDMVDLVKQHLALRDVPIVYAFLASASKLRVGSGKTIRDVYGSAKKLHADPVFALWEGVFQSELKSKGGVSFALTSKTRNAVHDLWVEYIAPQYAALRSVQKTVKKKLVWVKGDSVLLVKTSTIHNTGGADVSPCHCCGRNTRASGKTRAGTVTWPGKADKWCAARCVPSIAAAVNAMVPGAAATTFLKSELQIACPLFSDVMNVDAFNLDGPSGTAPVEKKFANPSDFKKHCKLTATANARTSDNAKFAIDPVVAGTFCVADFDRDSSAYTRSNGVVCTNALKVVYDVVAAMIATRFQCPQSAASATAHKVASGYY